MSSLPLTLIPFTSNSFRDEISQRLARQGYLVETQTVCNLLKASADDQRIMVFVYDDSNSSREKILPFLASARYNLSFGILICNRNKLDIDVADCFSDFSLWPCPEDELVFRIERLWHGVSKPDQLAPDQHLCDDLVHLNIIGNSPSFSKTIRRIKKFAYCSAPVLIEGETGTGKELAARAVHYLSDRRDSPFIPVNCGALPESLVENELFGHKKGAYTDACISTDGLITQAEGGTLFLDEVEALPLKAQTTLLRFLQENEYRPLGGGYLVKSNVRVITASNASLHELVETGSFRRDLLYRLNIMSVVMPPLSDRREDIELLTQHFLQIYRKQYSQPDKCISPSSIDWLKRHHWPGNVRELENIIHREFLLSEGSTINFVNSEEQGVSTLNSIELPKLTKGHLSMKFNVAKSQIIEEFESRYLSKLLQESGGNVTLAAKRAGKERRAFGKLLKKHGICKKNCSNTISSSI